jgi:hypothetical protein
MSEVRWAASHTGYRIARVSSLTETSAEVRILGDVTRVCITLLDSLAGLPGGVSVDSFEIDPSMFSDLLADQITLGREDDGTER